MDNAMYVPVLLVWVGLFILAIPLVLRILLDDYFFELEKERDAARRAGFIEVDLLERAPLKGIDTGPCLQFPGLAQFHPLRYLEGLVRAL